MKILLSATLIVLMSIAFTSCEQDETEMINTGNQQSVDQSIFTFSQSLSYALRTQPTVREFVKTEASKEIDGDFSIFYAISRNTEVKPGTSFQQSLIEAAVDGNILSQTDATAFFGTDILNVVPDLNVLLPEYNSFTVESWDATNEVPSLAFFTEGFEDTRDLTLGAIDANGNVVEISNFDDPTSRTIIVGFSERIMVKRNGFANPDRYPVLFKDNGFDYLLLDNFLGDEKGYTNSSQINQKATCERDSRQKQEELVRFHYRSDLEFRKTCHWTDGKCEFDVHSAVSANPSRPTVATSKKFFAERRKYFNDLQWYNVQAYRGPLLFHKWDLAQIGDPYKVIWLERDRSDVTGELSLTMPTVKFKTPVGEVSGPVTAFKIGYNPSDDELGDALIFYCDTANGEGAEYNTGAIVFKMKEQQ